MLDPGALETAVSVPIECFYKPAHAHIAAALRTLHGQGRQVDPVTVGHELTRAGNLDVVGGHQGLVELMAHAPATSNAVQHAEIVRSTAARRRLIALAAELADNAHTNTDPTEALQHAGDQLTQAAAAIPGDRDGRVRLIRASTLTMTRPAWAWTDRIPLAGVTLVPGREGEGKSALMAHLAARWSRGDLPGDLSGRPADVVYVGHEDDWSSVFVPRLVAAGADLDRFLFVEMGDGGHFTITGALDDLAQQLPDNLAAIILDPLDAHLGVTDTHKKADVQAAISRLAALTQTHRCAGIGIAHLNKGDATDVLLKVVGSVGLTTAVRSVLAVGPHPTDPDTDKVAVVRKANMTNRRDVPAVRFRVDGAEVPAPDNGPPIRTAQVVLLGEEAGIHADSILTTGGHEERSALEDACDWLTAVLTDGPVPKHEIDPLARHEGFTPKVLRTARERLGIVVHRDETQRGRPSIWQLPDYVPSITCPQPGARNTQLSDQGKHVEPGGYVPLPDQGHVIPTNEHTPHPQPDRGPTRDCTRCTQPATDISGLCAACITARSRQS